MNRNLIRGMILIGAVALSSCSVNRTASTSDNKNDDVYFSHATAAEEPVYITRNDQYKQDEGNQNDEDDYFYYDDYSSRINRFGYYSPFGYYDNLYYGYGGYGGLGYGYGSGWNVGLGFGYGGYGYGGFGSPWYGGFGYGNGFGYGYPWGGYGYGGFYSPYPFWGGAGYGYGGGFGGGYYGYRNSPRPYRGNGSPGSSFGNQGRTAYGGRGGYSNNNGIGYLPGRQNRNGAAGIRQTTNGTYNDRNSVRQERQPQNYQPSVERSAPSSFGGGGGRSSGGGGGGGRPVRN